MARRRVHLDVDVGPRGRVVEERDATARVHDARDRRDVRQASGDVRGRAEAADQTLARVPRAQLAEVVEVDAVDLALAHDLDDRTRFASGDFDRVMLY